VLGENITTQGVNLFDLSEGTRLCFGGGNGGEEDEEKEGKGAIVKITGLRVPRKRLNEWPEGVIDRCTVKDKKGSSSVQVSVMGVVEQAGYVVPGNVIFVDQPQKEKPLKKL